MREISHERAAPAVKFSFRRTKDVSAALDARWGKSSCSRGQSAVVTEWLREIAQYKQSERPLTAGSQLIRAGEPCRRIFQLMEGWAFLQILFRDGRRQILNFALPGAILGLHSAPDGVATYGVEALTDIVVAPYHVTVPQLWQNHPNIGPQLARALSRDVGLAFDHIASIGRLSAQERVARLLIELFIRQRMHWPGHRGDDLYLPLTQEHIGDAMGLTGVHVNRMLSELRKKGIIQFHYRHLQIMDPDQLMELAFVDAHVLHSWIAHSTQSKRANQREM